MAKYSAQLVEEICSYLADGLTQKDAAALVDISEDTFYRWIREKSEFSESVNKALAQYKRRLIRAVNKQAIKDGKFALEVLARRWPQDFGKKSETPVSGVQNEPIPDPSTVRAMENVVNEIKELEKQKYL